MFSHEPPGAPRLLEPEMFGISLNPYAIRFRFKKLALKNWLDKGKGPFARQMEAQTFPFDRGKCERRADREQHPLRTLGRASPPWRSSVGFFRLYVHFVTLASPAVRLECIRRFDDTHSATPYLAPPHPPLPIPAPTVQRHPAAHTVARLATSCDSPKSAQSSKR